MTKNKPSDTSKADKAESETDIQGAGHGPGKLESVNTLTLQTRQAERLVSGRKQGEEKSAIIGLMRYATLVKNIYYCAKFDDPYADWALLQIEEEIDRSIEELTQTGERFSKILAAHDNISLAPATSKNPAQVTLTFSNPYAYRGALLLAKFDHVAQQILTSHHVGLVPRDTKERELNLAGKAVRRVFTAATLYRHIGASKTDIESKTAKGLKAIEIYGELPPEVLSGERRGAFAPAKAETSRVISRRVVA